MTDTREQIAARAVAELSWTMNSGGFRIAAAHAAAGVSEGVRAVTARVRTSVQERADTCIAGKGHWLDLLALLDQIDAEWGQS